MLGLADISPQYVAYRSSIRRSFAPILAAVTTPDAGTHVTKRPGPAEGASRVPISSQRVSPNLATTPRIISGRARKSYQVQRPNPRPSGTK